MRDQFAIGVGDAFRLVDRDSQKPVLPAAFQFDFDHFNPRGLGDPFDDGLDFRENRAAAS